ncbi:MAG: hypothetical protein HY868_16590 [Chloroflexi bacterium]|nr:hypothetical protein [Chloroflexota bacterium]
MTMRMFDLKWFVVVFLLVALAVVMANGLPEEEAKPHQGQAWLQWGDDDFMPQNDCGKNYTLKLWWVQPDGTRCEHTRGTVSKEYVERIERTFEGEQNLFTDKLDLALDYIEKVIWRLGGYSPN